MSLFRLNKATNQSTPTITDHELLDNRLGKGDDGAAYHVSEAQRVRISEITENPGDGRFMAFWDAATGEFEWSPASESTHFRGVFPSLEDLEMIQGEMGDYAYVDPGTGDPIETYIWDGDEWIEQRGASTEETPESVKEKYESNANTNAFTDADKEKLSGVEPGAQENVPLTIKVGGVEITI